MINLKKSLLLVSIISSLMGQEYILKTQHLLQSQGSMTSDSLILVGGLGASISSNGSNDTLALNSGFLSAVKEK